MNHPIMLELQLHEYLQEKLTEDYPDANDETLKDTLEGLTNLNEKLSAVVRSQQEDRVLSDALKSRIGEMQGRHKRFEQKVSRKRELIATVMERAGIDKIMEDDFTLSLRQTPRPLQISDEGEIPEEFWRPQPPKLDRKKIISSLQQNEFIPGALLGNGGVTVSVRVK
jgi:hypothetical protein